MCINKNKWLEDNAFKMLCDFVAEGNLICLTGSGISRGLKLKNSKRAPDWNELLKELKDSLKGSFEDSDDYDNLTELLVNNAPGENLIEASSILYNIDKEAFLDTLVRSVDLEENETSETHKRLLDLQPKGILTYNYDTAHENAFSQKGQRNNWTVVMPEDNDLIIKILKDRLNKQFLFKMHGCVTKKESMVLTRESYRNLFMKYPFYKAFMQQIFTNYHLLIVGFRMSDPDFDMLLQNVFSTFGSPIQEHIVIKHISEKSSKDVMYRLRYGLYFLYVEDFSHINDILSACICTLGPALNSILDDCISPELTTRGKAHFDIRHLSPAGKKCLANVLEEKIKANIAIENKEDYNKNTENSELVYTYGVIASATKEKNYKDFLMTEVVAKSIYSEPVAHALVQLRDILSNDDLSSVEGWMGKFYSYEFKEDKNNPDPDNRVYKYCEAIFYLIKAKYNL